MLTPRSSNAQDSAVAARAAFDRGVAAADEGRYADAAAAFEASYRARPLPVVLHNLGLAYRAMGRNRAAIDAFERYLALPGGDAAGSAGAREIREAIVSLRASLVDVVLAVIPSDASVTIDGRPESATGGRITLDPGVHVVELRAAGYVPVRREVRLASGAQTRLDDHLTLARSDGRLRVEPSVPIAIVSIDGRVAGTGAVEVDASLGDHVVDIAATGHQPFHRVVRIQSPGLVRVDAQLASTAPARSGWVVPVAIGGIAAALGVAAAFVVVIVSSREVAPNCGSVMVCAGPIGR